MPVALPKFEDLHQSIESLAKSGDLNDFLIKKVERDINNLKHLDAMTSYVLLGMLSASTGDCEGMRVNHERALKINPADNLALLNYAVSLQKCGAAQEGVQYAAKALEIEMSASTISHALAIVCNAGQFNYAYDLVNESLSNFKDIKDFTGYDSSEDYKNHIISVKNYIKAIVDFIESADIDDDSLSLYFNESSEVIHKYGARILSHPTLNIKSDEDEMWLSCLYKLDLNSEIAFEMNLELSDQIAEKDYSEKLMNNVVMRFETKQ